MEDIFWSGTPLLESVGEHEPPVEELRATIIKSISAAVIPMKVRYNPCKLTKNGEIIYVLINVILKYTDIQCNA